MRIVFMGTPDFAVPCLKILNDYGFSIVGVITATDKLGGRGRKQLIESAVKKYAQSVGLPVLQPKNLKAPAFIEELRALKADLQVVVAFRMLPEVVWNMPSLGTINLHGSLLPAYRGAAPIHWAVINGEKETGVTTFFLKQEIDTGDLLMQRSMPIGPDETTGEVHDRMMELGATVILESVQKIVSGKYELQPQDESKVSKAPKLFADNCSIDFSQPASKVHNLIRGLSPFPVAWTYLNEQKLKIYRAKILLDAKGQPGQIFFPDKNRMGIYCGENAVEILELQLQGRKRVKINDFLNGMPEASLKFVEMKIYPYHLTDEEWKTKLSPEAYRVLREKGTERAFVGELTNTEDEGTYHCAGCDIALFNSTQKYHSGCGWPSFWSELDNANIEKIEDRSHGMVRTELVCSNCGGHQGHIFNDGPPPTHQRYCINSVSLTFKPKAD